MRLTTRSLAPALWTLPVWHANSTTAALGTPHWKMAFQAPSGEAVSAWHDLPLWSSAESLRTNPLLVTFVNEIPKGTRAKMELATKVEHNPIVQDKVKESMALRYFTYGDIPFNYGFAPRTWEDPNTKDRDTHCVGDKDPIDVVEIGGRPRAIGELCIARVLGVLALIDEGETDWKIIAEALPTCAVPSEGQGQPTATALCAVAEHASWKRLSDVPESVQTAVTHWFRYYKTTDGKPENEFAFGGQIRSADAALDVLETCHEQYHSLLRGTTENPGLWLGGSKKT